MQYSAVIRTLGKAGKAYQITLDSLMQQTIKPSSVVVYIAEGYPIPNETIGIEKYVYVPKGMVAQRALQYDEVSTEYCLFLDDDVYLPTDAVEKMYNEMVQHDAQVISPCTFENHKASFKSKLIRTLTGKEVCRFGDSKWGYKVLRTAGFSYNNNPTLPVYESQSNAGPCFFCRKDDFLKINYDEELWLDKTYYALPDDQIMFYKMYKKGLKLLTSFDSGIVHLDASTTIANPKEKSLKLVFSEYRNKLIFWHRFIYLPDQSLLLRVWDVVSVGYAYVIQTLKYLLKIMLGKKDEANAFFGGIKDALKFLRSQEYRQLPRI
jgi:glycosyltransferase involved in cell wall biosynthesis